MIHRSECNRIKIVFGQILPRMIINHKESDTPNIKSSSYGYLHKLEEKTLFLASKCIKDIGCEESCMKCNPRFIQDSFKSAKEEMEK